MTSPGGKNSAILSLTINDQASLYAAYMPWLKHGGLFVPTPHQYALGDEVFVLLTLMDEPDKLPIAGTVAWITPAGAQGNREAGIGVHFSDMDNTAQLKIETYLATLLESDRPTKTI